MSALSILRTLPVIVGLLAFPLAMFIASVRKRELWAVFIGAGIIGCFAANFWSDDIGLIIYTVTLVASGIYYFTHRGQSAADTAALTAAIRQHFHYVALAVAVIIAAFIYASLNRYYFAHDSATQRIRAYDRFTGRPVP